ncbi:uncharacterized protein LOC111600770 [Drosophila hydei]|uniref:Uncharacterized protein LOC111600770 n=1 Tax=Drosophila hydei TaxID=7224 RepID=A0A6J1M7H1_DROHY|nr:uncharacterized protein LOC111600770 [Drosophila hydei]
MQSLFNLGLGLCLLSSCCISINHAALLYPTNSEYGLFMAIAIPISLPHRNVFLSYNYEFNYYQPEHVYKFPPILMGQDFEDGYLTYPTHNARESRDCKNCTVSANSTQPEMTNIPPEKETSETPTKQRERRNLPMLTRKTFYAMISDKLDRSGYPAQACLLRLICETNASTLGEINGLLGNIVHVIFSPSSSRDEQLPTAYYQAEFDGLQQHDAYLAFVPSSTHGVFAALAVPLELPHRNVFVSYNFEANYNSPYNWSLPTLFQNGPIESEEVELSRKATKLQHADNDSGEQEQEQNVEGSGSEEQQTTVMPQRERRALLTRSNIYHILMDKFKRSGFAGESCLLRLICEINAAELGELNGVLGSLMHVLFSPSTSEPEQLPLHFYQAELDGWHNQCQHYEQGCGHSLLGLISEPFEQMLQRIEI